MVFPIQYALSWPERWENYFARLEPAELGALEFLPLDERRFPAAGLARRALSAGASAPAVFNGANEAAVAAFLPAGRTFPADRRAPSPRCSTSTQARPVDTLAEALDWDDWGRRRAGERLAATWRSAPPGRGRPWTTF